MKQTALLSAFATLVLAACAHAPSVVSAGANRFLVSVGGGIYEQDPSGIREKAYKTANDYCSKLGKVMEPIDVAERPYALGRNTASISLTFSCK